jgi:hypothetical protein
MHRRCCFQADRHRQGQEKEGPDVYRLGAKESPARRPASRSGPRWRHPNSYSYADWDAHRYADRDTYRDEDRHGNTDVDGERSANSDRYSNRDENRNCNAKCNPHRHSNACWQFGF